MQKRKISKRLLSILLTLVIAIGLCQTGAMALSDRVVDVGSTITLHTSSGTGHRWSCSDSSILRITNSSGSYCTLEGIKPGTAVVTVTYYETRQDLIYNSATDSYMPGTTTYQTYEAWDVIVRKAGDHNGAEASKQNGTVGENVSQKIGEIGRFGANGLVPVKSGELWGYADTKLNLVIPFQYEKAGAFYDNGLAAVTVDGNHYVIDGKGNYVIHTDHELYDLDGMTVISAKQYGGGWTHFTVDGKSASGSAYEASHQAYEKGRTDRGDLDYDTWSTNGEWRYLSPEDPYDWVLFIEPPAGLTKEENPFPNMCEGLVVVKENGLYGALDESGEFAIQPVYQYLGHSRGGYMSYKKDGKFGVLENPMMPPAV